MNVAFTLCSPGPGGAERVLAIMANHWAQTGWNVTVITYAGEPAVPFYKLHSAIRLVPLGIAWPSRNFFFGLIHNIKRIAVLRKAIKKVAPDCIISIMDNNNVVTLLASLGLRMPVIITEHTFPAAAPRPWIWKTLRRMVYPLADSLVVLSEESKQYFSAWVKQSCVVIPNPVQISSENEAYPDISGGTKIYAMGRFTESKRFDLLLRAFHLVLRQRPDCDLTIIGDGPLRGPLYRLSRDLGISHRVHFPGLLSHPATMLKKGQLFVMSSEYEGFPLAILEAMACGLPVVAFDCHGCNHIVEHGVNGILVPPLDFHRLAQAILDLLQNDSKRELMGAAALEIKSKYSVRRIMNRWNELVKQIVQK